MTDMSFAQDFSERLRPEEIIERARAAVAEGRTISHERMTEWLNAMAAEDGTDPDPPRTDRELDPGTYTGPSAR